MKYSSYNIFIELSDGDLLLVNTFSGAMFKVSEETRRKITEDSFDLQAIDLQQFQKTGIIIDDKIDELRYIVCHCFTYDGLQFQMHLLL